MLLAKKPILIHLFGLALAVHTKDASGKLNLRKVIHSQVEEQRELLNGELQLNAVTVASTGGVCWFDQSRTDCAICSPGACQCGSLFPTTCVECERGTECAKEYAIQRGLGRGRCTNFYTYRPYGTPCAYNNSDTSCAACQNNGCQCGPGYGHICIECGSSVSQCPSEASSFSRCKDFDSWCGSPCSWNYNVPCYNYPTSCAGQGPRLFPCWYGC